MWKLYRISRAKEKQRLSNKEAVEVLKGRWGLYVGSLDREDLEGLFLMSPEIPEDKREAIKNLKPGEHYIVKFHFGDGYFNKYLLQKRVDNGNP